MSQAQLSYDDFLAALAPERREVVAQVWPPLRTALLAAGYAEQIAPKFLQLMAGAEMAVALASQKNHLSLYLMPVYFAPELQKLLKAAAPRLKMGKSCVNFTRAEELPLATLVEILGGISPDQFLAQAQANRLNPRQG